MARIPPLTESEAAPAAQEELQKQKSAHGRTTNMKRTLAHSPPALHALMQWYPLREEVLPFLGERLTMLFAHAISSQTDCLICSTFFRRMIIDAGEKPDELRFDERETAVVEYGRQLARDANQISDEQFAKVANYLEPEQIVALTAFGGMMIATNVFNNALRIDLDEYLQGYRKK